MEKKFQCSFLGKTSGNLGVMLSMTAVVIAKDSAGVKQKLREDFSSIRNLVAIEIEDGSK